MMKKINSKNKGFALLTAIVTTGILLLVSFVVADIALKQLIVTYIGKESQTAFYIADSGAECAMFWDLKNPTSSTNPKTSAFDPVSPNDINCNGQNITPVQSSISGGGLVTPATLNFDFENGSVGSCPANWICTGDAVITSSSDGQGCVVAGNINGNQYLKAGCDGTTGTAKSQDFVLPVNIDHIRALRAGGADAGTGSGWFVKRASDNSTLCSAQDGTDSDTFFSDNCNGLSGYSGTSVYIYVVDGQNSGWGKTYLDNIQLMDAGNSVLLPGSAGSGAISTFTVNYTNPNTCAIVQVTKSPSGDTSIQSRGYNTCDTSSSKRFERGVSVQY